MKVTAITNDDEYFKMLERIVKGAEYLDNPLITKEDYDKGMKIYNECVRIARNYRTGVGNK